MFAHAVIVGDQKWNLKEALDIVVTVSEELNIVIPVSDVNAAVYIDVPLGAIVEVSFDNALVLDSQQTTYGVVIRLDGGVTTNCILNANGYAEDHVALAFSSLKDANTLERLLLPTNVRSNESAPHSWSGATDKSNYVPSDDGLTAPDPTLSDNQILRQRAFLEKTLTSYGNPMTTIKPSMLERIHPSQRASTEQGEGSGNSPPEYDEEPFIVDYSVEMATEGIDVAQKVSSSSVEQAIESINVSQRNGLKSGEGQDQDTQVFGPGRASSSAPIHYPGALGKGKQDPIGHLDWVPDIGPSNVLHFHTGLNPTEQETRSRVQPPQHAVSSVEHVINKRVAEDEDDLYYASPKVAKGHRGSPRSLAKDYIPKPLERLLGSKVQRPSAKKDSPMKLSRQLRNADAVVEFYMELRADDGLPAVTEDDAIDVKPRENNWKSKETYPTKSRNGTKESTKSGKKTQSRGKAIAPEEPLDTSLEDYYLPTTPRRAGSVIKTSDNKKNATGTRLKATRAQRSKPKKVKPIPKKAVTGALTIESAPKVNKRTKKDAELTNPGQGSHSDRLSGKKIDDGDDAFWDVEQAQSERERENLRQPRQLARTAKKPDISIPKSGKAETQTQLHSDKAKPTKPPSARNRQPMTRLEKEKPAPAALSQLRPRRTAAIKANRKIQGLKESDEIEDDEEVIPALAPSKRVPPVTGAKTRKVQNVENGGDDQRISDGKVSRLKLSAKDLFPDSVSPYSSDKQRPDPVSNPKAEGSSENFNTVRNPPAEAHRAAPGDKSDRLQTKNSISATDTSVLPLRLGQGDHSTKPDAISGEQDAEISVVTVDSVPDNIPQLYDPVAETKPAPISLQQEKGAKQIHNAPDATPPAGPGHQDQGDHFEPCADERSFEIISNVDRAEKGVVARPQAPTAQMGVRIRERRTSPQFAESAENSPLKLTSTSRDPFVTKLNASNLKLKDTSIFVRSDDVSGNGHWERKGPKTSELERSSRESKAKALQTHGAVSSGKTRQVESARTRLTTAMQVDWEGKSTPKRSSKPISEPISASRVESKRRAEDVGDTSNKRAKVVPKGRLEGVSAKRQPGFDAKKTPPPVVSNKPLVIGFSASGPRNQGTMSSKKSKPPNDVRSGTLDAAESRKHKVPNPALDNIAPDLASNQERLELTSEDKQPKIRIADVARKEAHASPKGKQAKHLETVNAVIPGKERLQEKRAEKRKPAPSLDDPAPWEHEQHSKRQKRDIQTPPNAQMHHPKMIPDLNLALVQDRFRRPSSQSTRVNENGSPMPFFIARNESATAEEQHSDEDDGKDALANARLEEKSMLQDDSPIPPEPFLRVPPLVSGTSTSRAKARAYPSLSNNSKQVPSSPHAASAFDAMPPHHLYHDGKIVNAETKQAIVPTDPQDPFLGATKNSPNAFLDALRCISTEFAAGRLASGADDKRMAGGVVVRPNPGEDEDPDKTLVELAMRQRHRQVRVSDNSSMSTLDSSTPVSKPDESPKEDSEAETEARWRKGLEPHQGNMLDCLLSISHVSNYLIKLLAKH